jgi:hypothetical protein
MAGKADMRVCSFGSNIHARRRDPCYEIHVGGTRVRLELPAVFSVSSADTI